MLKMLSNLNPSALALKGFFVLVVVAASVGVVWYAYHQGQLSERGKQAAQVVQTQKRITNADSHGPRTATDVDKRLLDGSF